jgi:hypothetical protein
MCFWFPEEPTFGTHSISLRAGSEAVPLSDTVKLNCPFLRAAAIAVWKAGRRVAGRHRYWGMDGIVGMVCLDLDRPDSEDEIEGLGGSAVLVGFEDGSVAQAWWRELAGPAECLAGRVGECLVDLLVGGCRAGRWVGGCRVGRWVDGCRVGR